MLRCEHRSSERRTQIALRKVFRVRLAADIHERATDLGVALPPGPARRARLREIAERGLLFIHIPKNGGTSISQALYGRQIGHNTIRYYQAAIPALVERLDRFAILREPAARFLSAYRHARDGEAAHTRISPAFHDRYRAFLSVDDALDHVEAARTPYAIDNIFRPQSWYVKDRKGALAVQRLIILDDRTRLQSWIASLGLSLPHLNRSRPADMQLSPDQLGRLRRIYAEDYELVDACRKGAFWNS